MKKAQMELSSTVLVTIIISVVIIGIGLILLFKFVSQGNDLKNQVVQQTDAKLQEVLNSDKKMFVVDSNQEGKSNKNIFFGVGVVNRAAPIDTYLIKLASVQYSDANGALSTVTGTFSSLETDRMDLNKNQGITRLFELALPARLPKGTYIFTFYACAKAVGDIDNTGTCQGLTDKKYAAEQAYVTI
jgi:hypothetical protein